MFYIFNGREAFYQWDINQKLIVNDKTIAEVHFTNASSKTAYVCEVREEDGLRVVDVPNILLQEEWAIKAYGFCEIDNCTKYYKCFDVISRAKPTDYVYTETEVKRWEDAEARIYAAEERVNEACASVEGKLDAVTSLGSQRLYGVDSNGKQVMKNLSFGAIAGCIPMYGGGSGKCISTDTPITEEHCANKAYVDNAINKINILQTKTCESELGYAAGEDEYANWIEQNTADGYFLQGTYTVIDDDVISTIPAIVKEGEEKNELIISVSYDDNVVDVGTVNYTITLQGIEDDKGWGQSAGFNLMRTFEDKYIDAKDIPAIAELEKTIATLEERIAALETGGGNGYTLTFDSDWEKIDLGSASYQVTIDDEDISMAYYDEGINIFSNLKSFKINGGSFVLRARSSNNPNKEYSEDELFTVETLSGDDWNCRADKIVEDGYFEGEYKFTLKQDCTITYLREYDGENWDEPDTPINPNGYTLRLEENPDVYGSADFALYINDEEYMWDGENYDNDNGGYLFTNVKTFRISGRFIFNAYDTDYGDDKPYTVRTISGDEWFEYEPGASEDDMVHDGEYEFTLLQDCNITMLYM